MFVLLEKTIKLKGNYYSTDTLETAGQITMSGSQTYQYNYGITLVQVLYQQAPLHKKKKQLKI